MSLGKTPVEDLQPFMACCCAVTSCYLACPECCGVFCKGTCCCFSCDEVCCKCLNPSENEEKKFCICSEGRATCLHPKTCCLMQEQCFCLDSRCAFPCTKDVPCMTNLCCINCCAGWKCACGFMKSVGALIEGLKSEPVPVSPKGKAEGGDDFLSGTPKAQEATDVDIGQLRSCVACCCCLTSAYCEFPKCCGAKCSGICCCLQQEQACCVPLCMNDTGDEKLFCVFQEGGCYGVVPTTCCFGQNQCCCCDTRAAFPCVAQVPCLFGCLGCVCNKKFKGACCKLNKELVYNQE